MAHGDDLLRKPLVEAIFELRWQLSGTPPGPLVDPNYKLLVGSLFGAVRGDYPHHEQLPTAAVPDELVPYLVQHRFRVSEDGYPLVQVGPGVFAINETTGYAWTTFFPRVLAAVDQLRGAYVAGTSGEGLLPTSLMLRYINALPFDFSAADAFEYMRDNLGLSVVYPKRLFEGEHVERRPEAVGIQSAHKLSDPAGIVLLKITSGEVSGQTCLLWEIQVQSVDTDVPPLDGLEAWILRAHDVARAWFYTLIEGKLEAEFNA